MYQKNCKSDALVTFMCAHKLKRKRREKKREMGQEGRAKKTFAICMRMTFTMPHGRSRIKLDFM